MSPKLLPLTLLLAITSFAHAQTTQSTPQVPDKIHQKLAAGTTPPPRIPIEKAPAPLYDDPIFHGASDPVVIWMPGKGADGKGEFYMYYTQRRATLPNPNGVDWVHGSAIAIANSKDGINWNYVGVAQGKIPAAGAEKEAELGDPLKGQVTWWAPTIFWEKGNGMSGGGQPGDKLHMLVTYVHGIFTRWTGDRTIEHFTSDDGINWTYVSSLPLASRRAIDPCVYRINDAWYVWYKNEAAGSRTFHAKSQDLTTWQDQGDAKIGQGHEAPFVWHWKGAYWDLQDNGRALDAWRSENGLDGWVANTLLLPSTSNGQRGLDRGTGHHPWIIMQDPASGPVAADDKQLVLYYFTHNGNKTYMQMAEITLGPDGKLLCDRDKYLATTPATQPAR